MKRGGNLQRKAEMPRGTSSLRRVTGLNARGKLPEVAGATGAQKRKTRRETGFPQARGKGLRFRSAKTARKYVTRRAIVAEMFAEPSICEVPWCTNIATDPHEPLTRARGGDILDRDAIRKVCNPCNFMFAADEQPWMYDLGFLIHSWDKPGDAA